MGYIGNQPSAQAISIGADTILSSHIDDGVIVGNDINSNAAIPATCIADGTVTTAEFQFINTLSSNAQTQLDGRITGTGALSAQDLTDIGNLSNTNSGDQTLPTDFVSKASGGTFAGAINVTNGNSTFTTSASWGQVLTLKNTNDDAGPAYLSLQKIPSSGGGTMADGDYIGFINMRSLDDAGNVHTYVELSGIATDVSNGSESSKFSIGTWESGTEKPTTLVANAGKVGIGTANPSGVLHALASSGSTANALKTVAYIEALTTSAYADGFGPELKFNLTGSGSSSKTFGSIGVVRDGGDTKGAMVFHTLESDTFTEQMRISNVGNVTFAGDIVGATDSYTKLLIHSDTSDGSTTLVDSSASGHTITNSGAHHEADQKKFGATSIYFASADFIKTGTNSDWEFDGDFTIDLWVYPNQASGSGNLIGDYYIVSTSTAPDWQFIYSGDDNKVNFWRGASIAASTNDSVPNNEWTHLALVRSGTGTDGVKIYINGVENASGTFATTIGRGLGVWVGVDGNESSEPFTGYIDELRISKGIARWTSNFTPPQASYSNKVSNFQGGIKPSIDNSENLGSATYRWANIYTSDLHLANERGDWTVIEESEYLTISNNKTGKRYKLLMEEI